MKRTLARTAAWLALALATTTATAAPAAIYRVSDLGSLPGGTGATEAAAINERGVVTGVARAADGTPRAFRSAGGRMTALSTLGGSTSEGRAINRAGVIVGISQTMNNDAKQHAFAAVGPRRMLDLGDLGGRFSQAMGVNDAGVVVGSSRTADGVTHAFRWHQGTLLDLGTLGGTMSRAQAINNAGVVVGGSNDAAGGWHAFVYRQGRMQAVDDAALWSDVYALNEGGLAVGIRWPLDDDSAHAFSVRIADGAITDLGNPLGGGAAAVAVNRAGDVVGHAVTAHFDATRAFRWSAGEASELNTLMDPVTGAGVVLERAVGINDRGQIVAVGWRDGDDTARSFLLTPQ